MCVKYEGTANKRQVLQIVITLLSKLISVENLPTSVDLWYMLAYIVSDWAVWQSYVVSHTNVLNVSVLCPLVFFLLLIKIFNQKQVALQNYCYLCSDKL